jgi:hypothetical protein
LTSVISLQEDFREYKSWHSTAPCQLCEDHQTENIEVKKVGLSSSENVGKIILSIGIMYRRIHTW